MLIQYTKGKSKEASAAWEKAVDKKKVLKALEMAASTGPGNAKVCLDYFGNCQME